MQNDGILTVDEAAARVGCNRKTITRWIASGRLKAAWLGSDKAGWRIRAADLQGLTPQRRGPRRANSPAPGA